MRSKVVMLTFLLGLLAHACVPVPIPGKAPPDPLAIKEKATRAEIEAELGLPVDCEPQKGKWERCTYRYRYGSKVWSWIGLGPPYLPMLDPAVWKAQRQGKLRILYGPDDKAARVFLGDFSAPDSIHTQATQEAECGVAVAQHQLGFDFEHGLGASEDRVQAYVWYSAAAVQSNRAARAALERLAPRMTASELATAEMLTASWKPRDCEGELESLQLRAAQGDVQAQWSAYVNHSLPKLERWTWLCRAADQGHHTARLELSRHYWFGSFPIPEDRVRAQMWLIIAARDDGQFATNQMRLHANKLSEAQIDEAQELAAQWKPGYCETELEGLTVK